MPLIVISGTPCSGKSTRAKELADFFKKTLNKEVHLISEMEEVEKANFQKNTYFSCDKDERHIRGLLKSHVQRLSTPQNVVILDAGNYIKGYRYELFCATKSNRCTQCTVYTAIPVDEARNRNESQSDEKQKYNENVFNELVERYEEPDGKNRWDAPLFIVFPWDDLDLEGIRACLFDKKPPKPNMSTQNVSLRSTNYMYTIDQSTKKMVDSIIKSLNVNQTGLVNIEGCPGVQIDLSQVTVPKLLLLRRQYVTYCKMHPPNTEEIPKLFGQYLATSLT